MLPTLRITLALSRVLLRHKRCLCISFFFLVLLDLQEYYRCIEGVTYTELSSGILESKQSFQIRVFIKMSSKYGLRSLIQTLSNKIDS